MLVGEFSIAITQDFKFWEWQTWWRRHDGDVNKYYCFDDLGFCEDCTNPFCEALEEFFQLFAQNVARVHLHDLEICERMVFQEALQPLLIILSTWYQEG